MLSKLPSLLLIFLLAATVYAQDHKLEHRVFQQGNGWQYEVRNSSDVALTALAFHFDCRQTSVYDNHLVSTLNEDALNEFGSRYSLLQPGEARTFFLPENPLHCHGGVKAAIFADGYAKGHGDLFSIYHLRRGTYDGLKAAYPILLQVAAGKISADAGRGLMVKQSRKALSIPVIEFRHIAGWDPGDLEEARTLNILTETLEGRSLLRLRTDDPSQRQPGIKEFAAANNLSLDQAQATLMAAKVKQWMDMLLPNLHKGMKRAGNS